MPELKNGCPVFSPELEKTNDFYDAGLYEQLAALEDGHFWFRSRNRLIVWALRCYFPTARNFFEIGCGTGFVISGIEKAFPDLSLCGSDIYTEGLTFASKRTKAELIQIDARRIPFEEEFDCVGAFDVLEHIEEDEFVLKEIWRTVRSGGGIMLTVPQHRFLWSPTDEHARHVRRYQRLELKEKVERAGFRVIDLVSFVSLLFPIMVFSRLVRGSHREGYNVIEELTIGRLANAFMEKTLDFERSLIRMGLRFPVGGSLLLMGYKR